MKSMVDRVHAFHEAMGLPHPMLITNLSVSARERRLRLTFEEFLETMKASGFRLAINNGVDLVPLENIGELEFQHIEGSQQDLVEIADGIGDQLVTNIGHALEHGIDIESVFDAIMDSNDSKLDPETGKPIINGQTEGYRKSDQQMDGEFWCDIKDSDEPGYRPDLPMGKILKPEGYKPPDIESVLRETNRNRQAIMSLPIPEGAPFL